MTDTAHVSHWVCKFLSNHLHVEISFEGFLREAEWEVSDRESDVGLDPETGEPCIRCDMEVRVVGEIRWSIEPTADDVPSEPLPAIGSLDDLKQWLAGDGAADVPLVRFTSEGGVRYMPSEN